MIDPYTEAMIKRFESCKLVPYKDIAGNWTIGWGRKISETQAKQYFHGITQSMADGWFFNDLFSALTKVKPLLDKPVADNKLGSLVSLEFNTGALTHSSHIIKYVNQGLINEAAAAFLDWDHAKVNGKMEEVSGLLRRRKIERDHFLNGPKPGDNINSYISRLFQIK